MICRIPSLQFLRPSSAGKRVWDFSASANLYTLESQPRLYGRAIGNPKYAAEIDRPIGGAIRRSLKSPSLVFSEQVRLVDLGPGYPDKTIHVLNVLRSSCKKILYSPVDVSPYFLRIACDRVARLPNVVIDARLQLFEQLERGQFDDSMQFVICIGPTFMNFEPREIVPILRRITRPGDLCLICAQYREGRSDLEQMLAPYRTSEVRDLNAGLLRHLGFRNSDIGFFVEFRAGAIVMGFTVKGTTRYLEALGFRGGDTIVTAKSFRHTLSVYKKVVRKLTRHVEDTVDQPHQIIVSWCKRGNE
jgi:hypothetical protein